jgi:hypothetical protein
VCPLVGFFESTKSITIIAVVALLFVLLLLLATAAARVVVVVTSTAGLAAEIAHTLPLLLVGDRGHMDVALLFCIWSRTAGFSPAVAARWSNCRGAGAGEIVPVATTLQSGSVRGLSDYYLDQSAASIRPTIYQFSLHAALNCLARVRPDCSRRAAIALDQMIHKG